MEPGFKTWQTKLEYWLTTLGLVYAILDTPTLTDLDTSDLNPSGTNPDPNNIDDSVSPSYS